MQPRGRQPPSPAPPLPCPPSLPHQPRAPPLPALQTHHRVRPERGRGLVPPFSQHHKLGVMHRRRSPRAATPSPAPPLPCPPSLHVLPWPSCHSTLHTTALHVRTLAGLLGQVWHGLTKWGCGVLGTAAAGRTPPLISSPLSPPDASCCAPWSPLAAPGVPGPSPVKEVAAGGRVGRGMRSAGGVG